jgi:hypothetical protein
MPATRRAVARATSHWLARTPSSGTSAPTPKIATILSIGDRGVINRGTAVVVERGDHLRHAGRCVGSWPRWDFPRRRRVEHGLADTASIQPTAWMSCHGSQRGGHHTGPDLPSATPCHAVDGPDVPIKVETRVRIPYGLPRKRRSGAISTEEVAPLATRLPWSPKPTEAGSCAAPVHAGQRGPGSWLTLLGRGPGTWATVAPVPG